MGGPEAVRTSGRVEWIAGQDQRGHFQTLSHRHRAHSAAHGSPSDGHPVGRDVKSIGQCHGGGAHRLDAHIGWVGAALPGGSPGELDPLHLDAEPSNRLVNGHQPGLIPSGTGPGGEHEANRA